MNVLVDMVLQSISDGFIRSMSDGLIFLFSVLLLGLLGKVNHIAQGLTGAFTAEIGSALTSKGGGIGSPAAAGSRGLGG